MIVMTGLTGHIFSLSSHRLLFTNSNLPAGLMELDGDFFFIRSIEGEDDKARRHKLLYYA